MPRLVGAALVVLLWLQYTVWFGQSGHFARERLAQQVQQQNQRVDVFRERNLLLTAEVLALKADQTMLEARARQDLGMIKSGEVFYLVPEAE